MKVTQTALCGIAAGLLMSSSVFANTLAGSVAIKKADGSIAVKAGQVEFDEQDVSKIKVMIEDHGEALAEKVKVARFEGENRTIVFAAFKNIGDMPEDSSLIVKANVIEGTNGKALSGDLYKRTCAKGYAQALSDHEGAFQRLMFAVQERKGCEMEYIGGVLFAAGQKD